MGHEITSTDNMFSVREMPWHGLGDVLMEHPTREEAQAIATPWEPIETAVFKKVPVVTASGELKEEFVEIEGSKGIERSDNGHTLGVVNDSFGIITNTEMWDVVEATGEPIETGGSLEGGKKVWALVRFEEPIMVKGDPNGATVAFLAFQNGHTGASAFRAQAINTRIVCANTSAAADAESKKNGYEFKFRHTASVKSRIDEAKAAVEMWREGVTVWQNAMEELVKVTVTPEQQELFVQQFQPMPPAHRITDRVANNVEEARSQLRGILAGPTSEGISLTAYGLFQAGVEWSQHYRGTKGADERSRMESYFKRNMLTDDGLRSATLKLAREVALA
jgi:phage/plasmid-like protein (TIGR03299 family)